MIFASKYYKSITLKDCKDFSEWVNIVRNEDIQSKKQGLIHLFIAFFFIKPTELPSSHIYWKYSARNQSILYIGSVKGTISTCKKLLEINPNHYYKSNILETILNQEEILLNHTYKKYPRYFYFFDICNNIKTLLK